MNGFLERLPKPTSEINLTIPMCIKEIEFVVKSPPQRKTLGPNGFTGEFSQLLWKK